MKMNSQLNALICKNIKLLPSGRKNFVIYLYKEENMGKSKCQRRNCLVWDLLGKDNNLDIIVLVKK